MKTKKEQLGIHYYITGGQPDKKYMTYAKKHNVQVSNYKIKSKVFKNSGDIGIRLVGPVTGISKLETYQAGGTPVLYPDEVRLLPKSYSKITKDYKKNFNK